MGVIVTGAAGFIGSCIVRALNDKGNDDIVIVDNISSTEKWKNLVNKKYREYVHKSEFLERLDEYKNVDAVIHMGACSSTTETDFDYLWKNNFEYTRTLWIYCVENNLPFIYASSAATYGDGSHGFSDIADIKQLRPLNGYGYSKHLFDLWAEKQEKYPPQHVGLKFFNVYGPNEYYKGSMASMVYHGFKQIKETGRIKLFKSYEDDIEDGMQLRDFVYVKDVCDIVLWLLETKNVNGLFNVGTGEARSFKELAEAIFEALKMTPVIEYIDMPKELVGKYQSYTRADICKLHEAGYCNNFYKVKGGNKEGVRDYVVNYLEQEFEVY